MELEQRQKEEDEEKVEKEEKEEQPEVVRRPGKMSRLNHKKMIKKFQTRLESDD